MQEKTFPIAIWDQPTTKLPLIRPQRSGPPGTRLWQNRNFTVFWIGQTLSALGDAFATIAIPLLMFRATGSVVQMGLVSAVMGVSQVVSGLFAGWLADRLNRRWLMIFCDILRALLYFSIPLGWSLVGPHIWLIYLIVAPGAFLGMIFQVAYVTAIANLVDADQLNEANGRLQTTLALAYILGPALAGLVSSTFGPTLALSFDALSFGISATSVCLIRLRPVIHRSSFDLHSQKIAQYNVPSREIRPSLMQEFLAGLHFLWRQPVLRSLTLLLFFLNFLCGGILDIFIFHLKHNLGQTDGIIGLVFGLASIGGVIAGVFTPQFRRRWGFATCWFGGLIAQFLAIALIGLSTNILTLSLLAILFTFTSTITSIVSITLRQQITPDYLLGRVTSAFWTITSAPIPLGAALFTALTGQVGATTVLVLVGCCGACLSCLGFFTPICQRNPEEQARC